jgi:hypothetical protein
MLFDAVLKRGAVQGRAPAGADAQERPSHLRGAQGFSFNWKVLLRVADAPEIWDEGLERQTQQLRRSAASASQLLCSGAHRMSIVRGMELA